MSPPNEETRLTGDETGSKDSAPKPTRPKASRPSPTQRERVRRALTRGWTCGSAFVSPTDGGPPILRYSSRISELRREGFYVDRRVCANRLHGHPYSTMYEWRIVGHIDDGTLPGIGAE